MKLSDPACIPDAIRPHVIAADGGRITLQDCSGPLLVSPFGPACHHPFRFTLTAGSIRTHTVLCGSGESGLLSPSSPITEHLDFFVVPKPTTCTLESEAPFFIAQKYVEDSNFSTNVQLDVPEVSQMPWEATPETLRRLCSPASIFMISRYLGVSDNFETIRDLCFNGPTQTYGIWPHNIAAMSRLGLTGAIIRIDNLSQVARLLAAGIPIAASLRFGEGEIPDFPFRATKGHMVVVRGISGGEIIVNDPAHSQDVKRRYPADLFMNVWQKARSEIGCAVGLVFWRQLP